ncbi:hypothetical protein [Rhodoplanes roseus]|uniref:hypothetical protein n=1 Tax=Rhodoplanes roseus TaxID=29409 RepID=UPI001AECF844|nr:hypothetical protein [Rhodoplanes roseus]
MDMVQLPFCCCPPHVLLERHRQQLFCDAVFLCCNANISLWATSNQRENPDVSRDCPQGEMFFHHKIKNAALRRDSGALYRPRCVHPTVLHGSNAALQHKIGDGDADRANRLAFPIRMRAAVGTAHDFRARGAIARLAPAR